MAKCVRTAAQSLFRWIDVFQIWIFIFYVLSGCVFGDDTFSDFGFVEEPNDTVVVRNKPAWLNCKVSSASKPSIEWKRNGTFISFGGETRRRVLSNGTLFFNPIQHSRQEQPDEGVYQCVARIDTIGTIVSRSVKLQVASLPRFIEQPHDQEVFADQSARFSCLIRGTPPASIGWLKSGQSLQMDKSRMLVLPSGSLEIYPVETTDAGAYRCNASNVDRYRLSSSGELTINKNFAQANQIMAPKFISKPRDTVAIEGSTVVLDCAANGNPHPTVTWLKDGSTIDLLNLDSRFHRVGVGSLQIENIQESDEGTYMCRAENHEDSFDAIATVSVQVPPRFVTRPSNQISETKENVEFECEIYGKPEPAVEWLKNGDLVLPTQYFHIENGHNLKILGLVNSDIGIYQCMGSNPAGSIQASAQLIIQHQDATSTGSVTTPVTRHDYMIGEQMLNRKIPSAPRNLIAVITSTRFITLSWREPKTTDGEIVAYSVYYREDSSQRERVLNTTRGRLEEINIAGLRPSSSYYIRVVAYNKEGPGRSSEVIIVITKPEAHVPGPPTNLRAAPISPKVLSVRWDPPLQLNGPIEEYKLYYMKVGTAEEHEVTTELTSHLLHGLDEFSEYSMWVVAINKNGAGSSTEEVLARTYSDVPDDPPQNVTVEASSSTSVIIRWEPPPLDSQNGIIMGYRIRYKLKGKRRGEVVTTDGNRRLFVLANLERNVQYNIRISAVTLNGTGPQTNWMSIRTYPNDLDETQLPGQPKLRSVQPESNSIYVSWNPPKDRNIMVRGYTIGWGKGFPDSYTELLDDKQRHFTIKKLEPAVEYVISLRAFNQLGDGIPVYETVKTGLMTTPEPMTALGTPMEVKAIVLSSSTVVLYWTDNSLRGKQVVTDNRYYLIRYSTYYSSNQRYRYINSTDLNCMIDGLKPNTQYEFSVQVIKGRRKSAFSLKVLNTTQEASPSSSPRDLTVVADDNDPKTINLNWQPPKHPNGKLIGYVIFYTTDNSLRDRDWVVEGVLGDKLTKSISGLTLDTTYYFKIQAHNSKGYGPFSETVKWSTSSDELLLKSNFGSKYGGGNGRKSKSVKNSKTSSESSEISESVGLTLYIVIACVSVVTLIIIIVVTVIVCCRRNSQFGSRRKGPYSAAKSNQKGKGSNKDLKPPDLWIHHDQMELKAIDKSQNNDGSMTLPRNSQEMKSNADNHTSTIDRRGNTTYIGNTPSSSMSKLSDRPASIIKRPSSRPKLMLPVDSQPPRKPIATPLSNGNLSQTNDVTCMSGRPVYPRTQYNTPRAHVTVDAAGTSEMQSPTSYCHTPSQHQMYDQLPSTSPAVVGSNPQYNPGLVGVSSTPGTENPSGSNNGTLGRRQSGHPLKSFSVPAPPLQSAPNTPQPKHVRPPQPAASPNKKLPVSMPTTNSAPRSRGDGTPIVTPRVPTDAVKAADLPPSYSTEELNQEMANLEGLMKDLNAITASQFEC